MMRTLKMSLPVAATAAVLALTACGGSPSASTEDRGSPTKSIKVVAAEYSSSTSPYWQQVAKDFTAKTGVKVELQVIGWNDIHQQVSTMVQTNQLPDVLNLDSFSQYAADDLLWPAPDIETQALRDNLPENLRTSGSYKGKEFGIPLVGSDSALFYNPAIFKQAGLTNPPASLDELQSDALAVSKLPGKVGFALSLSPEAPHIDFSTFMFNMGGSYMADGKWAINSQQNVKALEFLKGLTEKKATEVNPGKTGRVEGSWQLFEAGTAAMTIGQGGLADRLEKSGTPYKVAPFPAAPGVTPTSLGVADYIMAFKKPGNQDAVKQFLDLAFSDKNYTKFIETEGLLPVTSGAQAALAQKPKFGPYIEALKSAKFAPVGEENWDKVLGAMKNSLGLAVQGQDPQKVLDDIQAVATSS
ncbi:ABC transporter substrate-binding protein [Pedococcus sp. 5OH_020]|uniref:ABC transporter substrate-binding protein n=1 Tax=Pedococcus sp. 5OH_020 TaxID=2989814 RepID=UPI0022E9BE80|nr:sugar ABC transporter substrate-binding protein [Pedococcus sp. 5OH_020]